MAAAAILLLAGAGYGLYLSLAPHASTPNLGQGKPGSKAFEDENLADAFIFENIREESRLLQQRLKVYRAQPALANAPIKQNNPPGFLFPKDFIIGDLQFGDDTPVQATGFVPCPPDKHVCLYLSKFADEWPELLTKFGDDDLNGLELRTENTAAVIKTVSAWHKLDQLSFFNPLLKAVMNDGRDHKTPKDQDNEASCDESKITDEHLIALDRLSNLKSLGLCGIHVTGEAIVKMHLLNTLTALKLKRVSNIQKLLDVLPGKDNLRELWLVGQDTTDAQVEALTKMKNLETLRIRRCKLTPESLKAFKKMPALKHLYLDRPWTADVTEQFTNELPSYQYEPLTDRTYWKFAPDEKK